MTIAAIYDIHGNLPAVNAVLEEIEPLGVERIVIGGDVAYGPLVCETLDRLMELGDRCLWIRGNADRELVQCFDGTLDPSSPDDIRQAGVWEAQRITRSHRDFLAALPLQRVLSVEGLGEVLFCHGSPRSDEEILTAATPDERLRRILSAVTQKTVVCGHTHVQFDRHIGDVRVVNAGSVGMPYDEVPGAYWVLLGPTLELRRTLYDRERAYTMFRADGHPLVETFIQTLEEPTPAEEATAFFEKMAVQKDKTENE